MEKIAEEKSIAYYYIITRDLGGAEFYAGIDRYEQKIYCYFTKNFSEVVRIIDCNDPKECIGNLPGINSGIISKVIGQAFKVFKLGEYPQYLDYAA